MGREKEKEVMSWGKKQLQRGGLVLQRKIKRNELPGAIAPIGPPNRLLSVEITELSL